MTAKHLKGVYNLNPTSMVMKQGSKEFREERQKPGKEYVRGMAPTVKEAHTVPADFDTEGGVEEQVHDQAHPAMQTRHSHPSHAKHVDGRKHEDHHHAVKKMKG